ncbi:DitJ-like CoA ligase (AMP forming), possibly related to diterpenoid metabolism (plasmid) [Aromatoleum aromaticum EbN1]|uniref:DitJ-like CoA ligase (AMP forming), possibly related to diterpenoid metabolism n=1 Tax=Aromatoleum aromaticum (strain DSM 19018 / LMG 30748 / EbN1) TaxID=76114 RepID=Q5NW52_AROAE|nr:AMP-binding protein [Aromatoleum aromaticum]CAI10712.1 DitJ-like CoA ligase (AMP forming), possibly related to diterpenoid metabolism [Aromatoleum aromaticum EbN1]
MLTFPRFIPHLSRDQWTLPAVLEYQAVHRANRPFFSWMDSGAPETFVEVNARVNRLAHGLAAFGVAKGDLVGLLLPNCPEFIYTWFALCKLGAVELAISDAYKGAFLAHPMNLGKARVLFTNADLAQRVAEIEDDLPSLERIVIVDRPEGTASSAPKFHRIVVSRFEELYTDNTSNPDVIVTPHDPAAVLMTSGTTGPSKGVVMPHSQFYFFAEEDVQLTRLREEDVYMTGFPLFHGNAQFLTVYPCLIAGAHVVLYPRFSASDWVGRVCRSGATVTNLLGATMAFILSQPPSENDRAHRIRCIYAAPLSPDLAGKFTERFGVEEYVDGFGQTEISNVFMTPPDAPRPAGASGVLVDQWFEVKLVNPETDEDVPEGEIGELLVRNKAPGIMSTEYLGMPEKTIEARRNLWFHTGDALRRDKDGWYYFVDRVKDALRRRGENISSFEVEAGVRSHPAVAECAVVGVRADEAAGEDEVMACVVLNPGDEVSFDELSEWCEARMPNFMVPRYIQILPDLPRTASEKVRKKELRERGVTATTWDRLQSGKGQGAAVKSGAQK